MKKLIFVFLLAALIATPLVALDLSAGGDLSLAHEWNTVKAKAKAKETTSMNLLGINAFFDAEYVRAALGVNFSVGGYTNKHTTSNGDSHAFTASKYSFTNLRISVLGKYPFTIANIIKIYPLAGMEFDLNISAKDDGEDAKQGMSDEQKNDFNHYYLVLGAGADITIVKNFFISPKATFGFDLRKNSNAKNNPNLKGGHTMKLEFGVGVGYKF